ncbi:MAG: recombinase family protein [Candidatus Merdivicinus sp.]
MKKNNRKVLALYTRISKEDSDPEEREEDRKESNSIVNQRLLLQQYIKDHPEFHDWQIIEKCDDGYSGKRSDRPQFQEMMESVRKGEIQCILVKDFSRFSRDYIEIGKDLEQLFPLLGIRFISVNDHYDSEECLIQNTGLETAFQGLIYDFYSRDTSRKIRDIRHKLAREGKFTSANAPYGYQKSPSDHHLLIVDEEAADVVRRIYQLKRSGLLASEITRLLNAEGVPSPAQYALNHGRGMDWRRINEQTGWDASKVTAILKDERYTGTMVSLCRSRKGIYGKEEKREAGDWIRVPHTHEAIISEDVWREVQRGFGAERQEKKTTREHYNPFTCGQCGRKLSYSRDQKKFLCRFGQNNPRASCKNAAYSSEEIKLAVLSALKWHWNCFLDWQQLLRHLLSHCLKCNPQTIQKDEKILENRRIQLYESYRDGRISREEYLQRKEDIQLEQHKLKELLQNPTQNLILEKVINYRNAQQLSKELEINFVERVLVYDRNHIRIQWKFQDCRDARSVWPNFLVNPGHQQT